LLGVSVVHLEFLNLAILLRLIHLLILKVNKAILSIVCEIEVVIGIDVA